MEFDTTTNTAISWRKRPYGWFELTIIKGGDDSTSRQIRIHSDEMSIMIKALNSMSKPEQE